MSTQLSTISRLNAKKSKNTGKLKIIVTIQISFKIVYKTEYNIKSQIIIN